MGCHGKHAFTILYILRIRLLMTSCYGIQGVKMNNLSTMKNCPESQARSKILGMSDIIIMQPSCFCNFPSLFLFYTPEKKSISPLKVYADYFL